MKKYFIIFLAAIFLATVPARAGLLTEGIEELAERLASKILKTGGRAAERELFEYGGKAALKETLEKVSEECGENAAKKFVTYGERFGISAIRVMEREPALYIKAFDEVPENLLKRAVWAAERDPGAMTGLVKKYGSDVLVVAARHRGTGTKILEALGEDGIRLGKVLSEEQGITLAKNADVISGLALDKKKKVIDVLLSAPGRAIDYLEKHPRVLHTATGVALFISLKNAFVGTDKIIKSQDGKTIEIRKRGIFDFLMTPLAFGVKSISIIIMLFLVFFLAMKLFFSTRYNALKYRLKKAALLQKSGKKGFSDSKKPHLY